MSAGTCAPQSLEHTCPPASTQSDLSSVRAMQDQLQLEHLDGASVEIHHCS